MQWVCYLLLYETTIDILSVVVFPKATLLLPNIDFLKTLADMKKSFAIMCIMHALRQTLESQLYSFNFAMIKKISLCCTWFANGMYVLLSNWNYNCSGFIIVIEILILYYTYWAILFDIITPRANCYMF